MSRRRTSAQLQIIFRLVQDMHTQVRQLTAQVDQLSLEVKALTEQIVDRDDQEGCTGQAAPARER